MGTLRDKSDEEYSVIGDKGDIGFIDYDNCRAVCSYNPAEESDIVNISIPFPFVNGQPQSAVVGETKFDAITIRNITKDSLDLWSVSMYDAKPENSFTLSILKPPTADSDEDYIQNFMESVTLEDRVLRTDQDLTIWLSCKPKEIGLHSAAVHFSVGDETIERLVFILAEDKISKSLSSAKPYQRARKKKPEAPRVNSEDSRYVIGRRPAKESSGIGRGRGRGRGGFGYRLPKYPIPDDIRNMVTSKEIPEAINEGLTMKNYGSFFKVLLVMEEIKLEEDIRVYDMEGVTMTGRRNQFLSLEVPGLAEKRPSLVNGDYILVQLVTEDGSNSVEYQGFIHRVEAEEIYLKFDQKFHRSHRDSNLYNVRFTYNRLGMRRLYQAVETAECMDKSFLFPPASTKMRLLEPMPLVPISCTLNEEQIKCIETILASIGGCPYLIHGPPGTGKTMTLIEAILQIYKTKKSGRILVCAPSNSAADHILERLISQKSVEIKKNELFRLNAFTRLFEDVNPNHLDFCRFDEECLFKCPSRWELSEYRIIISTYTSSSLLYSEGVSKGHFTYFFLDEAGQASEPETMVPLSNLYTKNSVVVLAGDPNQLGPVVFNRDAESYGLGTSYLERLFDCELYNGGNRNFMTKLVKNYRTHKAILSLPSELFYEGELCPCKEESTDKSSPPWIDLIPNKDFPLLFIGIQGCDEREGSNPSWFNRIEASKVVEIIKSLLEKGMKEEDIGVITPYRQQVSKIRGALDSVGTDAIKVGSVEQFQGQEREVIVISTVRSTVKHNEFDKVHYLGFLSNSRRFNVAITRARSLLIVIGNPHILCKDPSWDKLLWYCVDNDSYKGCFLPERPDHSARKDKWGKEDQWQASETRWEEGDQWQPSETQWGEADNWGNEGSSSWKPSEDNWNGGEGDQWQPSETQWGEADNWGNEGSSSLKPSEDNSDDGEGDNQKSSEVQSSSDEHSDQLKRVLPLEKADNYFQPSDVPWE